MATKKEINDFVKKLYPESLTNWQTDRANSLHPTTDVAQAGLETGWKIKGIDNKISLALQKALRGKVQQGLLQQQNIFTELIKSSYYLKKF